MAFYNRKMSRNKSLTKAWRAAHLGKLDDDKEICLPEICDEIARWMRRDRHPRNRLSLRSFSVLLSGAIRLYNRQLGHLLKDTFECSILTSVTPRPVQSTLGKEKLISECSEEESSELMPEIEETECSEEESSELMPEIEETECFEEEPSELMPEIEETECFEEDPSELMPEIEETECFEEEPSELMPEIEETDTTTSTSGSQSESTEYYPADTKSSSTNDFDAMADESTVFIVTPNSDQQPNISAQASGEKRDQQVQTSSSPVPDYNGVFDPNLPLGSLIVHDSYQSGIPTKILFSNLSENIKYLPIHKPMN